MSHNIKLKKIPIAINPDYKKRKKGIAAFIEQLFYQHKNKLLFVHIVMFVFFMLLLTVPLFTPLTTADSTIWNNFRLFSSFIFWGLWFPLVFFSVLFVGRLWCGVLCPLGAASEWVNKFGLKLPIPAWLRWEGTPILSFVLITVLGQTVDVRDQASAMLEIFGGTLLLALIIGFLFGQNKRAWCRHACPIGLLLGVFSRLGAVQLSPKMPRSRDDRYATRGICPTFIDINHKAESRHCIECFRCVKPSSNGGLFLRFRRLGSEIINIGSHNPNIFEVWFIFLSTGIALGGFLWLILPQYQTLRQIVGEWFINHQWYWIGESGPFWLMSVHPAGSSQTYNWLDFIMILVFMFGFMLYSLFWLVLCNSLTSFLAGFWGSQQSFRVRFTQLGYLYAPVAMLSIILGLGDQLFLQLQNMGLPILLLQAIKLGLVFTSLLWSIYLGFRLLQREQISYLGITIALLPSLVANIAIIFAWWPAIFGLHFSALEYYRTHLL